MIVIVDGGKHHKEELHSIERVEIKWADAQGDLHELSIMHNSQHNLRLMGDSTLNVMPEAANTISVTTDGW